MSISFFPPPIYLPLIVLLSLFFLFGKAWRLPLGLVKLKCIWEIWHKISHTVFINPVIYSFHWPDVFWCTSNRFSLQYTYVVHVPTRLLYSLLSTIWPINHRDFFLWCISSCNAVKNVDYDSIISEKWHFLIAVDAPLSICFIGYNPTMRSNVYRHDLPSLWEVWNNWKPFN